MYAWMILKGQSHQIRLIIVLASRKFNQYLSVGPLVVFTFSYCVLLKKRRNIFYCSYENSF
jgi:hypothetical protein